MEMHYTYDGYKRLVEMLRRGGYSFCNYHDWMEVKRPVVFRHDIDTNLDKATKLAELERTLGISSTYFVLLTSDFYNPHSLRSYVALKEILDCGHEIGLHFDETRYLGIKGNQEQMVKKIQYEAGVLSEMLGTRVSTVSMHIPSKETLDMDLEIPGMINSYGKVFFHGFKYLSDSARRWREPVLDIIQSGVYDKLHILTHPFWYNDVELNLEESVTQFTKDGTAYRDMLMSSVVPDFYKNKK